MVAVVVVVVVVSSGSFTLSLTMIFTGLQASHPSLAGYIGTNMNVQL